MGNERILIVEDHRDSLRAMVLIAERCGLVAETAESVAEALAKLDGQGKVLLDLRLPDGTGADVLRVIRSEHKDAAVAVASAESGPLLDEVMLMQPDLYLRKPIDVGALLRWLLMR